MRVRFSSSYNLCQPTESSRFLRFHPPPPPPPGGGEFSLGHCNLSPLPPTCILPPSPPSSTPFCPCILRRSRVLSRLPPSPTRRVVSDFFSSPSHGLASRVPLIVVQDNWTLPLFQPRGAASVREPLIRYFRSPLFPLPLSITKRVQLENFGEEQQTRRNAITKFRFFGRFEPGIFLLTEGLLSTPRFVKHRYTVFRSFLSRTHTEPSVRSNQRYSLVMRAQSPPASPR